MLHLLAVASSCFSKRLGSTRDEIIDRKSNDNPCKVYISMKLLNLSRAIFHTLVGSLYLRF